MPVTRPSGRCAKSQVAHTPPGEERWWNQGACGAITINFFGKAKAKAKAKAKSIDSMLFSSYYPIEIGFSRTALVLNLFLAFNFPMVGVHLRYVSHTVYQIEYHFVWVTKYRYKVLQGEIAERVRELVRQICEAFEIRILRRVMSKDHVHILVSAPPNLAPSEIMRRIKGRTSSRLFEEFLHIKKRYWGRHFLGEGLLLRHGWADD